MPIEGEGDLALGTRPVTFATLGCVLREGFWRGWLSWHTPSRSAAARRSIGSDNGERFPGEFSC